MKLCLSAVAVGACLMIARAAWAQDPVSYPVLRGILPVAVQIGATAEVEVVASNDLRGASGVIVSGAGVAGEIVPPPPPAETKPGEPTPDLTRLKVRFTAAADALPGPRQVRLFTPRGASTLAEIVLTRDPITLEAGDNNTPDKAQPAPSLPTVICGQVEAKEDIDCFRFHLDGPQSLVFHAWSQRLQHALNDLKGRRFIDPILTLRTASGTTLATNDNYFSDDPLLCYSFAEPGDYVLEIRDVRYHGWGDYWPYAIEINARPLISQAFPLALAPGVETRVSLIGLQAPADAAALIALTADGAERVRWVSPVLGGQSLNAVALLAADGPLVEEALADNNLPAAAQPLTLPVTVNGRIESPGDVDCYSFDAKAGEQFSFECLARRAGSPLDSALRILDAQGAQLVEVDDLRYSLFTLADSELESWTAPSDGKYVLEIRDVVSDGGPQFTYALNVGRSQPRFMLEANSDKTLLAPGVNSPIYMRVDRRNGFTGEVQLAVEGLPPGVTAECGRILTGGADGCIILRAAPDAAAGAANIAITGHATHALADGSTVELAARARPLTELWQDGGGRGLAPVSMHTVSIATPMDVRSVRIGAAEVTLAPGQSQKIDVTIERAPGFKGNVTLDALFQHLGVFGDSLPKGVTVDINASKAILTGEDVAGHITLTAAADAPSVDKQLVPLMAHVSLNFAMKLTFCEALRVSVTAADAK